MATGGATHDDWKEHLTCSLCLDIFTHPKMMPGCNHTFCLTCLEELASRYHDTFPCPECRAEIEIPDGGVAAFQTNRFYRSADLLRARDGTDCATHAKMEQDTYCVDCSLFVCSKCALKDHKFHTTKELHEAARDAKTQIRLDFKRLQEAVSYMSAEVEAERKEQNDVDDNTKELEAAIQRRHAAVVAMADKYRDDMLTSLRTKHNEIQQDVAKQLKLKENNLDNLCQLQQQAQQAITGHRVDQLLNFAKEMKDGRGSSQAIDKLKTPSRKSITRPVLTFKISEDVGKKQMEEFMQGKVEKVTVEPEVTVKQQFQCGPETDIEIFFLCPQHNGEVWVSYAWKGLNKNSPCEVFNKDGKGFKFMFSRGKMCSKTGENGNSTEISYKDFDSINTFSKSPALSCTFFSLKHLVSFGISHVVQVTMPHHEVPYQAKYKTLFTIRQPGSQRAFDVPRSSPSSILANARACRPTQAAAQTIQQTSQVIECRQQLFVVLEDAQAPEKRRVHLYHCGQKKALATYTPPSLTCQLSDVCFMELGGQEVLLVADEAMMNIHVVGVQSGSLVFLRYLATDRPLPAPPTALNTDFEGRLWVACRGGAVLTITPLK